MNLTEVQKAYLYSLFYEDTPIGIRQKSFNLEVLQQACSVIKKLLLGSEEVKQKDKVVGVQFSASELEFTAEEIIFIQSLLKNIKSATPAEFEVLTEVQNLFKPL